MPLISLSQFIGKTFVIKNPTPFYRVNDVNNNGDKAKPVGTLKIGYSFIFDSFLTPRESGALPPYPCPPLCFGKREYYYFTFKGRDGNYYAVRYLQNGNQFDSSVLRQQGVKTVEEQLKAKEDSNKSILDTITDSFKGLGKTVKIVLFVGVGVFALGYLIPKITKK